MFETPLSFSSEAAKDKKINDTFGNDEFIKSSKSGYSI